MVADSERYLEHVRQSGGKYFGIMVRVQRAYRIAQNSGGVKLWRIDRFRLLARKTLAN